MLYKVWREGEGESVEKRTDAGTCALPLSWAATAQLRGAVRAVYSLAQLRFGLFE